MTAPHCYRGSALCSTCLREDANATALLLEYDQKQAYAMSMSFYLSVLSPGFTVPAEIAYERAKHLRSVVIDLCAPVEYAEFVSPEPVLPWSDWKPRIIGDGTQANPVRLGGVARVAAYIRKHIGLLALPLGVYVAWGFLKGGL